MTGQHFYHIGFGRQDLGPSPPTVALLAGDPDRARQIAQETEGVSCEKTLSQNRGLNSYLCRLKKGRHFLSCTSGMGAPSLSIVINELCQIGIKQIIRVGTCGAIQPDIKVGSVIISQAALCRQGAADDIAPKEYPAVADPFLTVCMVEAAKRLGIDYRLGITASTDTFYEGQERTESSANPHLLRHLQGITDEYSRLNILNYEMEAGTLFKQSSVLGLSAGCVCGVLAERSVGERVALEEKEKAVGNAIRVALETLRTEPFPLRIQK